MVELTKLVRSTHFLSLILPVALSISTLDCRADNLLATLPPIKTTGAPNGASTPFTSQPQLRGPQSSGVVSPDNSIAPISLPDGTKRGAIQKLKWDDGDSEATEPFNGKKRSQSDSAR